ncbi:MAG: TraR/DksA family transcriptional regulator [Mycobacteriales bacterium]
MDENHARVLIENERDAVRRQLADSAEAGREDRQAENQTGDSGDAAEALTARGVDDAVTANLRRRLAALNRADQRLEDGTYGRSIRSGQAIPDERLAADPAAELTIEEARQEQAGR